MYRIGEFSRITQLSIKALRLYHEKGLIVPSVVDQDSGYRYYDDRDIEKAQAIVALKGFRCSLGEIQELLGSFSEDSDLYEFLTAKRQEIRNEQQTLDSVASAIDAILENETRMKSMQQNEFEIEVKQVGDLEVVSQRWQGKYEETGKAVGALYRAAGRKAQGSPVNLIYDCEYRADNADVESCLPVKSAVHGKDFDSHRLEGGRYACLMHKGGYDTLSQSYARLFDFINQNGEEADVPTREIYHKGPGMVFKGNPDRYLTEIQIPIK